MEHRYNKGEGVLIMQVPSELDHHSADKLKMETEYLLSRYPARCITFDFADTGFMDSSGIGVMLGRCRSMGLCGGKVRAIHLSPRIRRIFHMSGLEKVMEVEGEEMAQ